MRKWGTSLAKLLGWIDRHVVLRDSNKTFAELS